MLEASGNLDLSQKALGAERMGQLLVKDLEGDQPIVPEIARQVDRGHAPAPELGLEQVAVTKSIAQGRVNDSHGNCLEGTSGMCSRQQRKARNPAVRCAAQ
jgi:hypothetical protein